jgi:hypothetical protein
MFTSRNNVRTPYTVFVRNNLLNRGLSIVQFCEAADQRKRYFPFIIKEIVQKTV